MDTYRQAEAPNQASLTSTQPLRASRIESEFVVPALQTIFTMGLVALDVVFWRWHWIAGVIGGLALLVWAWRMLRSDKLMWKLERMTGLELDGKPGIGKPGEITLYNPAVARQTAAAAQVQAQGEHSDQERMLTFVKVCFAQGTSEAAQGIKPNTAARQNYVECRDALLALGIAQWRNSDVRSAGWDIVVDAETALSIVEYHT